ncbi:hypothetical protein [Sagittula sp. S175]|uniref:hypothetical protein n=1 Tax=Sagittula sp. S175 TaxID=3415129 RepID=UPI003C7D8D08
MKIIPLYPLIDSDVTATSIAEDDAPEWDVGTTYDADEDVISASTHWVYRSVQTANTGNDPETDDGTWWTPVVKTAPYRPFDGVISSSVSFAGPVTMTITPRSVISALAVFNMGASCVTLEVATPVPTSGYSWYDFYFSEPDGRETFSQTVEMIDIGAHVYDYWTYFFGDLSATTTREALITGFTAFPGQEIRLTFGREGETVEIGEIKMGVPRSLGTTITGTESEIRSYTRETVDDFGGVSLLKRAPARPITFEFAFPFEREGDVLGLLTRMEGQLALFYADDDLVGRGLMTLGYYTEFRLPHEAAGVTKTALTVKAVV